MARSRIIQTNPTSELGRGVTAIENGLVVSNQPGFVSFLAGRLGRRPNVLTMGRTNTDVQRNGDVRVQDVSARSIQSVQLLDGSISSALIADLAVITAKIADLAVTSAKIGNDAVITAKILDLAVTTAKIADSAVNTIKIADSAVTKEKLDTGVAGSGLTGGAGTALGVNVDDSTIEINADTLRVKAGGITANEIATGAVGSDEIATGAVGSDEIATGAVGSDEIASNAVGVDEISTAVAGNGLAGGGGSALSVNVDDSTIEINSDSLRVKDGGITQAKMASSSVGTGQLKTGTGSASGSGGASKNTAMNDYTFMPALEAGNGNDALVTYTVPAGPSFNSDTVGRINAGTTQQFDWRWRYITASDNPRIWLIVNAAGDIVASWESEDPPNQSEPGNDMNPFEGSQLLPGERIVKVEPFEFEDIDGLLRPAPITKRKAHTAALRAHIAKTGWIRDMKDVVLSREIIQAVPVSKKRMAKHWMFRKAVSGKSPARALRLAARYSFGDGRAVFKPDALDHL